MSTASGSLREHHVDWRYPLVLTISLVALGISILNSALIAGGITIPVPGLRPQHKTVVADTATFNFETDAGGWATRGAATNATVDGAHVFAGRQALAFQVTNLSSDAKAFVYTTLPAQVRQNARITAHLYTPIGTPPLIAAIYLLDKSWAWYNGQFPVLVPGQWTTVTYTIAPRALLPARELGLMIVGSKGFRPYSGSLYLDSVDVQNR